MANKETNLQNQIMLTMSKAGMLVYRQMVGKFRPIYNNSVISVGVPGMADIGAIKPITITPDMVGKTIGVAVNVEVKTETGKQQNNQKIWETSFKSKGGVYIVSRDHKTVIQELNETIF